MIHTFLIVHIAPEDLKVHISDKFKAFFEITRHRTKRGPLEAGEGARGKSDQRAISVWARRSRVSLIASGFFQATERTRRAASWGAFLWYFLWFAPSMELTLRAKLKFVQFVYPDELWLGASMPLSLRATCRSSNSTVLTNCGHAKKVHIKKPFLWFELWLGTSMSLTLRARPSARPIRLSWRIVCKQWK